MQNLICKTKYAYKSTENIPLICKMYNVSSQQIYDVRPSDTCHLAKRPLVNAASALTDAFSVM